MNAPGIMGMSGKAYQWTWTILEEELFHLIHLCTISGYHPKEWWTSIVIALQKPKRDYSLPHPYRLIQLLEVLGKVLEWIQACHLSYIVAKQIYSHHPNLAEYLADPQKTPYYVQFMMSKPHGITKAKLPSLLLILQVFLIWSPTCIYSKHSACTTFHSQLSNGYIPSWKTNGVPSAWMAKETDSIQ